MTGSVIGFVAAVIMMVGLVALDSKVTNWLVPEPADLSEIEGEVARLDRRANELGGRVFSLELRPEARDGPSAALTRLAGLWAVHHWSDKEPGVAVRGTDPKVKACVDYVLNGSGSFVECGFERVGP